MIAATSSDSLGRYGLMMAVIWLVGFAIQQALQLVDPVVEAGIGRYKARRLKLGVVALPNSMSEAEFKRSVMGLLAFLIALSITACSTVRLLDILSPAGNSFVFGGLTGAPTGKSALDAVLTALVLGAGTDGANTAIKYFGYVKDARAAAVLDGVRSLTGTLSLPSNGIVTTDSTLIEAGRSDAITVSYEQGLGPQGAALAVRLAPSLKEKYEILEQWFGIDGGAVSIAIRAWSSESDGSGGGRHDGCDFDAGGQIDIDATFGNSKVDPTMLAAGLCIAEISECFMGPHGKGWDCGANTGEALSRVCARLLTSASTMAMYVTGPAWVNAGKPNYITRVRSDDVTPSATGCVVLYVDWMMSQGKSIQQIIAAGGDIGMNYTRLTGKASALDDFRHAVSALTTPIVDDTPFTGAVA